MSALETAARELANVYEDYFEMSKKLQSDMNALVERESETPEWRRNFVRTSWPMIEAYASTLRNICSVISKHAGLKLSKRNRKLLEDESRLATTERLKQSLKLAFNMHELEVKPIFSDANWLHLRQAIRVRDRLMHPKKSSDLDIAEDEWQEIFNGITWVLSELFSFFEQVHKQYGPRT